MAQRLPSNKGLRALTLMAGKPGRRVYPSHLRRDAALLGLVVIGLLAGTIVYSAAYPQWPPGLVTPDQLKVYATSYISEYQTLFSSYTGMIFSHGYQNHFIFGFGAPNAITGVVSLTRGALIMFNESAGSSFAANTSLLSTPAEYYLWPRMPSNPYASGIAPIIIENGTYVLTAPVTDSKVATVVEPAALIWYNGTGSALRLSGNGSVVILGSLVYPGRLILKGSNTPASWSPLQARFDALDEFLRDGGPIFNASTVRTIQTNYRVPLLLTLIGNREGDGSYRSNPGLFTTDFNELSKYASPTILQQVQTDYYNSQKVQPASWEDQAKAIVENPLFIAIVVSLPVGILTGIIVARYTNRRKGQGE